MFPTREQGLRGGAHMWQLHGASNPTMASVGPMQCRILQKHQLYRQGLKQVLSHIIVRTTLSTMFHLVIDDATSRESVGCLKSHIAMLGDIHTHTRTHTHRERERERERRTETCAHPPPGLHTNAGMRAQHGERDEKEGIMHSMRPWRIPTESL
jgi:hypothetical protein